MTKKIFRSILLAVSAALAAVLAIVTGSLYEYYNTAQKSQLKDELRLAAYGVEEMGQKYSRMFAGNQIQPARTVGCLRSRRWIAGAAIHAEHLRERATGLLHRIRNLGQQLCAAPRHRAGSWLRRQLRLDNRQRAD